ncbi:hypothetical protein [Rhodococcus jostii]|uniref:hypothetical protein n=1 Tax=Rhodococcus jostii TaxID=132919 RepID=UPI00365FADCD
MVDHLRSAPEQQPERLSRDLDRYPLVVEFDQARQFEGGLVPDVPPRPRPVVEAVLVRPVLVLHTPADRLGLPQLLVQQLRGSTRRADSAVGSTPLHGIQAVLRASGERSN